MRTCKYVSTRKVPKLTICMCVCVCLVGNEEQILLSRRLLFFHHQSKVRVFLGTPITFPYMNK